MIYVASLSKVLAPGMRLGFIVAHPAFIRRARELRRTMLNHPPLNNQRSAAFFLSLDHYDALMMRMARIFQERRTALRDALNYYRSVSIEISPEVGGTTYWVRLPEDFNVDYLVERGGTRGHPDRARAALLRQRGPRRRTVSAWVSRACRSSAFVPASLRLTELHPQPRQRPRRAPRFVPRRVADR
ncbi:MAG: aminotransferase class I/II-fold pyridoxal phosphate-dependent enzyme [Woeseiaceae bacterium]|nr:aminotransferase class I/II-fold pyridoxal phosphate-dependent enzyme [Woeseiaceae bacterium]